jgi:hypothetical protein
MKPSNNHPTIVYQRAHRDYPCAVGLQRLYGVAFFGHGKPQGVKHTTEGVWRGLIRMHIAWLAFVDSCFMQPNGRPLCTWTTAQRFWHNRYFHLRESVLQDHNSVESWAMWGAPRIEAGAMMED